MTPAISDVTSVVTRDVTPDLAAAATASLGFQLHRNAFGQLVLTTADGARHEGVVPVRAFPIAAPDEALSLVAQDGHELVWIDRLDAVPEAARALLLEEIASREFIPELRRIRSVSTFSTPSVWHVETDRGATELTLKGEEDIRRITRNALLIADSHGLHFLIRDLSAMDRTTRRFLDRFL